LKGYGRRSEVCAEGCLSAGAGAVADSDGAGGGAGAADEGAQAWPTDGSRAGAVAVVFPSILSAEPVAEISWPCPNGCHWQLAASAEGCKSWELRYPTTGSKLPVAPCRVNLATGSQVEPDQRPARPLAPARGQAPGGR
jgi:hypothetical protein